MSKKAKTVHQKGELFYGTPEGIFIASLPSLFKSLPQIKNKEERCGCDTLLLGTPEGIFIASLRSLRLGKRSAGAFGFGFASLPSLFKSLP